MHRTSLLLSLDQRGSSNSENSEFLIFFFFTLCCCVKVLQDITIKTSEFCLGVGKVSLLETSVSRFWSILLQCLQNKFYNALVMPANAEMRLYANLIQQVYCYDPTEKSDKKA